MHLRLLRWTAALFFLPALPLMASQWDATWSGDATPRVMATTDSDGNGYMIQRASAALQDTTITRIGRDGIAVWTVSAPIVFPTAPMPFSSTSMTANAVRVCYYVQMASAAYCHAASDGAFQGRIDLTNQSYDSIELNAANQLLLRRLLGGAAPALAFDANNVQLPTTSYTPEMLASRLYSSAGYELHFPNSTATSITEIQRQSLPPSTAPVVRWAINAQPATLPDGHPAIVVLDDGSVLALTRDFVGLSLRKLNADGSFGFRKGFGNMQMQVDLHVIGDLIVLSSHHTQSYVELTGLSLTDGSERWHHLKSEGYAESMQQPGLVVEADGLHALWLIFDGHDFNARRIRLADGIEVARVDLPCGRAPCPLGRLRADTHGITLLPTLDRRERALFVAHARADQESLEGAWYQPSTSGQGILFDYLPQSRTWFGTWHHSIPNGLFEILDGIPALRWLTLQGQASADGRHADLGIYITSSGQFDAGPRIDSRLIGTATLSFDSCHSANLNYQIELPGFVNTPGYSHKGSIPLQSLMPAPACASVQQAPVTLPAIERNGISSRFSGTWYNPATSGQGLELSIRPEIGNGTVFAGWFTYDPASQSDDGFSHHWFTLQGELITDGNGSITLPIFRTIGGELDQVRSRDTSRVGEVTWHFTDCSHSELSYRFDNSAAADLFAGHTGTIALQRLGECTAP